jgi:phage gp29-like protein
MKARAATLRTQLRQLPTQSLIDPDDIGDIIGIMRHLRQGTLRDAALLCDAIEGDDRIKAVQETRVGSLRATSLNVKPAADRSLLDLTDGEEPKPDAERTKLTQQLAQQLGGVDDVPGEWDRIFPPGVIGDLCRWGTLLGIGVAEQIYPQSKPPWIPRLKIWHPQFIRWDWARDCYRILTADGEIDLPRLDENPNGDGRWLMWCPYGYREGFKRGLIRAMGKLYVMRQWDERDWARWNETKGLGIVKAIMPMTENEEVDQQFLNDISNRGSEAVIAVRKGEEGNQYDIENVSDSAGGEGWKSFQEFKRALDVDIAVLWLGQNLTTESPSNGSSSKSLGEVQRATSLDRLKVDAGIATAAYDQVIVPMTTMNYGDPTLAPLPVYVTEPPKDQLAEATAMKMTGDGVTALKGAGIPVDERAIGEDFGVPMKTEEQAAAEKAIADEEAAAKMQAQRDLMGQQNDTPPSAEQDRANPSGKAALRATTPAAYPRRTFAGLPVAIEHAAGTTRIWRDAGPNGQTIGSTKMLHDYGFIEGHMGADGEELDVYLGPDENAPNVHVIHQNKAPDYKSYDEDKTMLGFAGADEAKAAYMAHRNDGDRAIRGMSSMPLDRFKAKLKRRTGTGPVRASAVDVDRTTAALVALASKAAVKPRKGKACDADRLTANATRLASRALAPYVTGVRGLLDGLADHPDPFGELKKRLVTHYRKADPSRLATVVERTRVMAHMAGRADVHAEHRSA